MKKIEQAFFSERAGLSIVDFLADELPLSKSKIKEAVQKGAVWRHREGEEPERVRRAKEMVKLKDDIHIYYDENYLALKPPRLQLVEDFEQYSIWYKPPGFERIISLFGDYLSVERALVRDIPHDRDCYWVDSMRADISGLMLVAHTRNSAAHFTVELQQSRIEKDYALSIYGHVDLHAMQEYFNVDVKQQQYIKHSQLTQLIMANAQDHEETLIDALAACHYTLQDADPIRCLSLRFLCPLSGNNRSID